MTSGFSCSVRRQPLGGSPPAQEQFLRGGGDLQLGRVAPAVVELLALGGGEARRPAACAPGGHAGLGALASGRRPRPPSGPPRAAAGAPAGGWLVSTTSSTGSPSTVQQDVGGFVQAAGQRGDASRRGRCRSGGRRRCRCRPRATEPSGQHGHAQRVLQAGLVRRRRRGSRSRRGRRRSRSPPPVDATRPRPARRHAQRGGLGIGDPDVARWRPRPGRRTARTRRSPPGRRAGPPGRCRRRRRSAPVAGRR